MMAVFQPITQSCQLGNAPPSAPNEICNMNCLSVKDASNRGHSSLEQHRVALLYKQREQGRKVALLISIFLALKPYRVYHTHVYQRCYSVWLKQQHGSSTSMHIIWLYPKEEASSKMGKYRRGKRRKHRSNLIPNYESHFLFLCYGNTSLLSWSNSKQYFLEWCRKSQIAQLLLLPSHYRN